MEALTISAANLDIIEKNLGSVAKELNGVITNVNDVNSHVNEVEQKVAGLNNEIKNLIEEIRENTTITNARQTIMYNNEQIEKKYGYYNNVRRTVVSILDALTNTSINVKAIKDLKEEIILRNPNYWLANALAALIAWFLNDRDSCEKELNSALKKNPEKTSLFFCLVNLKLGRTETSINWLKKYLISENPTKLDKDFVTVLDLVATGTFGDTCKEMTFKKIDDWIKNLSTNKNLEEEQINLWTNYLNENRRHTQDCMVLANNIDTFSNEMYDTLADSRIYENVLNNFQKITYNDKSNKEIDEILSNLIYEYEDTEQEFQLSNLKNKLLLKYNGNKEEAEKEYNKQSAIYKEKTDLLSLLTNIVMYKEEYNISNESQKICLALIKKYILASIERKEKEIPDKKYIINIANFQTSSKDGMNHEEIEEDLNNYLTSTYIVDDKDLLIALIIINILGMVGIFITLNNKVLSTIIIAILIIGNIVLFYNLNKKTKIANNAKNAEKNIISNKLEEIKAELIEYNKILKNGEKYRNELKLYLNNLNATHYINSNGERNIIVGEENES